MHTVLNLYAGLGGNRKHWDANVTAVEIDPKIAAVYQRNHPEDTVIIGDAHEYLLDNFQHYDFIWSSPPCQSHTRMIRGGRNRKPRYPVMDLYQEIIFLNNSYKGKWVVENFINEGSVAGAEKLKNWLGIHYEGTVYYSGNHDPAQVLRNCVHPEIGKQIFEQFKAAPFQPSLWE